MPLIGWREWKKNLLSKSILWTSIKNGPMNVNNIMRKWSRNYKLLGSKYTNRTKLLRKQKPDLKKKGEKLRSLKRLLSEKETHYCSVHISQTYSQNVQVPKKWRMWREHCSLTPKDKNGNQHSPWNPNTTSSTMMKKAISMEHHHIPTALEKAKAHHNQKEMRSRKERTKTTRNEQQLIATPCSHRETNQSY